MKKVLLFLTLMNLISCEIQQPNTYIEEKNIVQLNIYKANDPVFENMSMKYLNWTNEVIDNIPLDEPLKSLFISKLKITISNELIHTVKYDSGYAMAFTSYTDIVLMEDLNEKTYKGALKHEIGHAYFNFLGINLCDESLQSNHWLQLNKTTCLNKKNSELFAEQFRAMFDKKYDDYLGYEKLIRSWIYE